MRVRIICAIEVPHEIIDFINDTNKSPNDFNIQKTEAEESEMYWVGHVCKTLYGFPDGNCLIDYLKLTDTRKQYSLDEINDFRELLIQEVEKQELNYTSEEKDGFLKKAVTIIQSIPNEPEIMLIWGDDV